MPQADRRRPVAPQTHEISLGHMESVDASVLDERPVDLDGVALQDVVRDRLTLGERDRLESSLLQRMRVGRFELPGVTLVECVVQDAEVPVLTGPGSQWRDVELRGGRLGSAQLYDVQWRGVVVSGCKISYLNLQGAELTDVVLLDCTVAELDLVGSRVTRLALPGSRVRRLDLTDSTLRDVDLRGLDLAEITGVGGLRGATVSQEQLLRLAPILAGHLGIDVCDDS